MLVEGGGRLIGSLLDAGQIDEVHAFIAPRLFGGADAPGPIAGLGAARVGDSGHLEGVEVQSTGGDVYLRGRIRATRPSVTSPLAFYSLKRP